jgi:hypothetical protein
MSHLTSRDKIFVIENSLDTDLDRNVTRDGLRLTASPIATINWGYPYNF